jgi:Caspase domain
MMQAWYGKRIELKIVFCLLATMTGLFEKPLIAQDSWEPEKTRVFIVSLASFEEARLPSFSTSERLDDRFAELFTDLGVPEDQVLLLKDSQANVQQVKKKFEKFLRESESDETLIFYLGSHGGRNAKTGEYTFCAYNADISFDWLFDAIEQDFEGRRAILIADCCYSGGISVLAQKRDTEIEYACLSSTFANQVARSGWRFMQCLIRGFSGETVVDINQDGQVELSELAEYSAHYMAFVAEGKPVFATFGNFPDRFRLTKSSKKVSARQGDLVEARAEHGWEKAEVLDVKTSQMLVHFTKNIDTKRDAWISSDRVRTFRYPKHPVAAWVEAKNSRDDLWNVAQVLERWESLHLCRYKSFSSTFDEWVGPDRLRPMLAGDWKGLWKNDLNQKGAESLDFKQDEQDQITGVWSGNVSIQGERVGPDVIYFAGSTDQRKYQCIGKFQGDNLRLDYCAQRAQQGGRYFGWAELARSGSDGRALIEVRSVDPPQEKRRSLTGSWQGTYENSLSNSGQETLRITEQDSAIIGDWSGVQVTGVRLGNTSFHLSGRSGKRHYTIVGLFEKDQLILHYAATAPDLRYFGKSTLVAK